MSRPKNFRRDVLDRAMQIRRLTKWILSDWDLYMTLVDRETHQWRDRREDEKPENMVQVVEQLIEQAAYLKGLAASLEEAALRRRCELSEQEIK